MLAFQRPLCERHGFLAGQPLRELENLSLSFNSGVELCNRTHLRLSLAFFSNMDKLKGLSLYNVLVKGGAMPACMSALADLGLWDNDLECMPDLQHCSSLSHVSVCGQPANMAAMDSSMDLALYPTLRRVYLSENQAGKRLAEHLKEQAQALDRQVIIKLYR